MPATVSLPQTLTPFHAKYYAYELATREFAARRQAAEEWCVNATAHAATYGGKPWRYALVAHDVVAENMSLVNLVPPAL